MCLFLTRNRAGKTSICIGRMVSIFVELFLKLEILGQSWFCVELLNQSEP